MSLGYLPGTQTKRRRGKDRGWGKEGDKRGGEGGVESREKRGEGCRGQGRLKACVHDLGQNTAPLSQISWDTDTSRMERKSRT